MKIPSRYKFLPPELAERLRNFGISLQRPVEGGRQGFHKSPHHGSSVEFAEYREYMPGDPPQLLDWAVYARSDRFVIRKFQEETNVRAYILLDTSESLAFQEKGIYNKLEYASFLAAGLMYILIHQGDSVGMVTFDRSIGKVFTPVGTFDGLRPILLELEKIKPSGRSDIEASVHQCAELVQMRSLIILISDFLSDPAGILRAVRHLHCNGHDVTLYHVLDRAEIHLPFAGVVEIKELETGSKMLLDVEEIREAYIREVERYLNQLQRGCMECMADYHLVDTQMPLEQALAMRANPKGR